MPRQTQEQLSAEIVAIAGRLFGSQGYGATSVQQIADAMGYSKAAVLYHFPSKDALLGAVLREAAARITEIVDDDAARSGDDARRHAVERYVDLALTRSELGALLDLSGRHAELHALAEAGMRLRELLRADDGQDAGVRVDIALWGVMFTARFADKHDAVRAAMVRAAADLLDIKD
ncbi:TetR/AcrR family transcriptional regulator [Allokutzneria sp. A3M-2-11 16]|uniref:TetR/AcrR family transcriptional regulator n=1 Tax=Allokutzneria sp. A3M-2-11 16 TaxID=2962043 RepID=UPI0020B8FB3F|nr:TetR/AcrR family transcriptional regulator [Allokutzneria sp. A3M-2-11 16]MCP3803495.1 TetR/AcrR family transcriptional regulator [Allokutzneria sp. A3M-2-11 16]